MRHPLVENFLDYWRRNYPADTVLVDTEWHAERLGRVLEYYRKKETQRTERLERLLADFGVQPCPECEGEPTLSVADTGTPERVSFVVCPVCHERGWILLKHDAAKLALLREIASPTTRKAFDTLLERAYASQKRYDKLLNFFLRSGRRDEITRDTGFHVSVTGRMDDVEMQSLCDPARAVVGLFERMVDRLP